MRDDAEKGAVPVPWVCWVCDPDDPPRYCGVCALRQNWGVGDEGDESGEERPH